MSDAWLAKAIADVLGNRVNALGSGDASNDGITNGLITVPGDSVTQFEMLPGLIIGFMLFRYAHARASACDALACMHIGAPCPMGISGPSHMHTNP